MKHILIFFIIIIHSNSFSQIGIDVIPTEMLDVNGSTQLRREIRFPIGSIDSPGNNGDYLISNGESSPPSWVSFPKVKWGIGQSILLNYNANDPNQNGKSYYNNFSNYVYIDSGGTPGIIQPILENSSINDMNPSWDILPHFSSDVYVNARNSKISFNLQLTVQITSLNFYSIGEVSAGVFIDGKLKSVSSIQLAKANQGFEQLILFDVIENINPKPNNQPYKIELGIRRRYSFISNSNPAESAKYLLVGLSNTTTTNTNSFMNHPNFTITLYEPNN